MLEKSDDANNGSAVDELNVLTRDGDAVGSVASVRVGSAVNVVGSLVPDKEGPKVGDCVGVSSMKLVGSSVTVAVGPGVTVVGPGVTVVGSGVMVVGLSVPTDNEGLNVGV